MVQQHASLSPLNKTIELDLDGRYFRQRVTTQGTTQKLAAWICLVFSMIAEGVYPFITNFTTMIL